MGQSNSSTYLPLSESFDLDSLDGEEVELYPGGEVGTQASKEEVDTESELEDDGFEQKLLLKSESVNVGVVGEDPGGEGCFSTFLQIFLPFLLAGFGMVGAGLMLDRVQHWRVFQEISEIFILVPALLGLKGNLEMTLASRLSTAANLGKMDGRAEALSLITSNLALLQVQGITVGFLASLTGLVPGLVFEHKANLEHGLLLCASSVVTASLASFLLGLVMVLVILVSRWCSINPDNVATPIAASLGDLITLSLLAWVASLLWADLDKDKWLAPTLIFLYFLVIPVFVYVAWRHPSTQPVLVSGWTPVLLAMLVSSGGGYILKKAVTSFPGIAVFQPVMNGVGGNLVAVQASRMSTSLHSRVGTGPGSLPPSDPYTWVWPWTALCPCSLDLHARTAALLMGLVVPGQAVFCYTISYLEAGHTPPTPSFLACYLVAALLQVGFLLYICRLMVYGIWKAGVDPDNSAIPYLTALGDLLGGAFLAVVFFLISQTETTGGPVLEQTDMGINKM